MNRRTSERTMASRSAASGGRGKPDAAAPPEPRAEKPANASRMPGPFAAQNRAPQSESRAAPEGEEAAAAAEPASSRAALPAGPAIRPQTESTGMGRPATGAGCRRSSSAKSRRSDSATQRPDSSGTRENIHCAICQSPRTQRCLRRHIGAVVRRIVVDELDVGRQPRARIRALDQIVAQQRVAREPAIEHGMQRCRPRRSLCP